MADDVGTFGPADPDAARRLAGGDFAAAWRETRAALLAGVADLDDAQWRLPCRPGVNPLAWELAHVAWFGEFWTLRGPHRRGDDGLVHAARPARIAGPDDLLDSSRLPHAQRWSADLPAPARVRAWLEAQLDACLAALPPGDDDEALAPFRLALFHEAMHVEALAWTRATLGLPPAPGPGLPRLPPGPPLVLPGGPATIGWPRHARGFAFDNERDAHEVRLAPFEIDAAPVTAGRFQAFVEAGGYDDPAWWPGEDGRWRAAHRQPHPAHWRRAPGGGWEIRWFDRWLPLDPRQPVIHVSAHEAQAWARWAGRRLPSAAEWEHAATQAGFAWGGSVWEWTADDFRPYPGFAPGPYHDYSAPWFGDHRELRGGAFATAPRLHHLRYRNFFRAGRTDVFAGFRTAR